MKKFLSSLLLVSMLLNSPSFTFANDTVENHVAFDVTITDLPHQH